MLEKEGVLAVLLCRVFITCPGKEKSRSQFKDAERPSPPIAYAAPSLHARHSQGVRRSGPKSTVSHSPLRSTVPMTRGRD